jgi:carbon monoxide dehydrogenase subunit G
MNGPQKPSPNPKRRGARMLRWILAAGALLVALLLVVAARGPDTFRVERSTTIAAPPEAIFPLINDLRRWVEWSPYEGRDPALRRTYTGPESGPGAVYEWEGNRDVGRGRMRVADAAEPTRVRIDVHFLAPFEGRGTADFTLASRGDGTQVTWAMHGPNTFLGKVMGLFFSMDSMLGADFEQGLAQLRAAAEGGAEQAGTTLAP